MCHDHICRAADAGSLAGLEGDQAVGWMQIGTRGCGVRLLEVCPMVQSKDSRSLGLFVGSARVFEKAGFQAIAERKPGRPLMRLEP